MGLVMICWGGGLGPNLLRVGEPISRGLEGGNDTVSGVPQEPDLEPCLCWTNRAVPPRALDKASSSSFVVTFSEVSLGRRDFLDWCSFIDATALLTSLLRTGWRRTLRTLSVTLTKKLLTRTFATLGLWETLSKSEHDDSKLDNADRDSAILGHLVTIAPRTIYQKFWSVLVFAGGLTVDADRTREHVGEEEPRPFRHHRLLRMQALDEVDKRASRGVLNGFLLAQA